MALYDTGTTDFTLPPILPNPPADYERVRFYIRLTADNSVLYVLDSAIVGLPNWAGFPADPAAALIDWLTTKLTAATGDAPIAFAVPYTGGYAMDHVNANKFVFAADCSYDFGTLAIPAGDHRNFVLLFSNAEENTELVNQLLAYIAQFDENPILYCAQIKSIE